MTELATDATETYLSVEAEYLGFLNSQLRDLKGYAILANEMIQNADDATGAAPNQSATSIVFDVCDDALVVTNDGVFTDCGTMHAERCPWLSAAEPKPSCDLHRFRRTASGGKRLEAGTTGAFGIGFIAVYQITDHPELKTGNVHWTFRPEEAAHKRCAVQANTPFQTGTQFRLPWATDPDSAVRRALSAEPVQEHHKERLQNHIADALPQAILFLKNLSHLEVRRNGNPVRSVKRISENHTVLVEDGDQTTEWHLFYGDFAERARTMKARTGGSVIEAKRGTKVVLAVPRGSGDLVEGLLCATLPTQQKNLLGFHINADFYPSSDRKRILFEGDYQAAWNEAAIEAAAEALAKALPTLPDLLGFQEFWALVSKVRAAARNAESSGTLAPCFGAFWRHIKPLLEQGEYVYTAAGKWKSPARVRLLPSSKEEAERTHLLSAAGLSLTHEELRPYFSLFREIGVNLLSIEQLGAELAKGGLSHSLPLDDAPDWIRPKENREVLARLITELGGTSPQRLRPALGKVAIAVSTDGKLCPPEQLWIATPEHQAIVQPIGLNLGFVSDADNPPAIRDLSLPLTVSQIVFQLQKPSPDELQAKWQHSETAWIALLKLFSHAAPEEWASGILSQRLKQLFLWPSEGKLHPLTRLMIPGGFSDPLGVSRLVDDRVVSVCEHLLVHHLNVGQRDLVNYARLSVPQYFHSLSRRGEGIPADLVRTLSRILAENLGKLRDHADVRAELAKCPLIFCEDSQSRLPSAVYFRSDLVTQVLGLSVFIAQLPKEGTESTADFYRWLGVVDVPRSGDIVARIRNLAAAPPDAARRSAIQKLLICLSQNWSILKADEAALTPLRSFAWLPATGDSTRWHMPNQIYASYREYLFKTQAQFVDLTVGEQNRSSELFDFLNVPNDPPTALIVGHLMECVRNDVAVKSILYEELQRRLEKGDSLAALTRLKEQPCLRVSGQYIRPDRAFWQENPYGNYAYQLDRTFAPYERLLNWLGVREQPDAVRDTLRVLLEISEAFGVSHQIVDTDTKAVVERCWRMLQDALDEESATENIIHSILFGKEVVLDDRDILVAPEKLFFEDRPHLADRFKHFLNHQVITRQSSTCRSLAAAGVRSLNQCITVSLAECEGEQPNPELTQRLHDRIPLIYRIVEPLRANSPSSDWHLKVLDQIRLSYAERFLVSYAVNAFNQSVSAEPERPPAFYNPDDHILYYQKEAPPWAEIAKEIAHALNPAQEPGSLSSGITHILAAPSTEAASGMLDSLGYAPLEQNQLENLPTVAAVTLEFEEEADEEAHIFTPAPAESTPQEASPNVSEVPDSAAAKTPPSNTNPNGQESAVGSASSGSASSQFHAEAGNATGSAGGGTSHLLQSTVKSQPNTNANLSSSPANERSRTFTPNPATQGGRLRSYVSHGAENRESETGASESEHRRRMEEASMKAALDHERSRGRLAKAMPYGNEGYDIESRDESGVVVRYIEVKSIPVRWGDKGVGLTDAQFRMAQEKREKFWLYVVECADKEEAALYCIQNPAQRVDQFFFDHKWREVATPEAAPRPRSILDVQPIEDVAAVESGV